MAGFQRKQMLIATIALAFIIAGVLVALDFVGVSRVIAGPEANEELELHPELSPDEIKVEYPGEISVSSEAKELPLKVFGRNGYDAVAVEVTGQGVEESFEKDEIDYDPKSGEVSSIEIKPGQGGELTFHVEAYIEDKLENSYEGTIDVDGYLVEIEKEILIAEKTQNFSIEVMDREGEPVNDASVYLKDAGGNELGLIVQEDQQEEQNENEKNGNRENEEEIEIKEGEYKFEDIITMIPGEVTVEVKSGKEDMDTAYYTKGDMRVIGEGYTIDTNVDKLVAGVETKLEFRVLNEYGGEVEPDRVEIYVDSDTDEEHKYDKNDLRGNKQAYEIGLVAFDTVEIFAVEENTFGEITLDTVPPDYDISHESITDRYERTIEFELVNPLEFKEVEEDVIDESALEVDKVHIETKDALILLPEGLGDVSEPESFGREASFDVDDGELDLLVFAERRRRGKVNIFVDLEERIKIAELDIEEAEMDFSTSRIMQDRDQAISISLKDTAGNSLADYKVTQLEDRIARETNAEGRVRFELDTSENRVYFEAETDVDIDGYHIINDFIEAMDVSSPRIIYPEKVEEEKAIIKFFDSSRVYQIFVNGTNQQNYVMEEVEIEVELEPGENEFEIYATDVYGNSTKEEITITFKTEEEKSDEEVGDEAIEVVPDVGRPEEEGQDQDVEQGEEKDIESSSEGGIGGNSATESKAASDMARYEENIEIDGTEEIEDEAKEDNEDNDEDGGFFDFLKFWD